MYAQVIFPMIVALTGQNDLAVPEGQGKSKSTVMMGLTYGCD